MTERYLVMPRGINVGTRNRVPMAQLRSKLADAGYSDVATVLQSGNLIVSTESAIPDEVAGAMQRLLSDEFEVDVPCVVRTANQVRRVLNRNPLQEVVSDPSRYLVNFLSEEPDPEAWQERCWRRTTAPRRSRSKGPRHSSGPRMASRR